jgi:transcriptional regulator with XRE-family HTH domain
MRFEHINTEFGTALKKRRNALGFSQKDFAEKVNLSRASIANIERGEQGVTLETLYSFCAPLKCSPFDLLPKFQYSELDSLSRQSRMWVEEIMKEVSNA